MRGRPLHQGGGDAFGRQDADRVAATEQEGGVAEADHAAVADEQIEAGGGETVNQHPAGDVEPLGMAGGERRPEEREPASRRIERQATRGRRSPPAPGQQAGGSEDEHDGHDEEDQGGGHARRRCRYAATAGQTEASMVPR